MPDYDRLVILPKEEAARSNYHFGYLTKRDIFIGSIMPWNYYFLGIDLNFGIVIQKSFYSGDIKSVRISYGQTEVGKQIFWISNGI